MGEEEIVVGITTNLSLEEELEDLFMKYGLQGLVATYILSNNKIKVTSYGNNREYLAYATNRHINREGCD